ncbi:hypothetical protein N0V88_004871 [Collariella sp. IMI 366227]|nr:hypothetical protein N0V88_004871 [Collariella sp. IMI 366227]
MAPGDKFDRQLDRLEKLFSRKKRADELHNRLQLSRPLNSGPIPAEFDATTQRFPQPSFIRPKSSRMMAREEVLLTASSTRRARSLPDSPRTPRLRTPASSAYSSQLTGSELSDLSPPVPKRLSSLGAGVSLRSSSLYSDLDENDTLPDLKFAFPSPPKKGAKYTSPTRRSSVRDALRKTSSLSTLATVRSSSSLDSILKEPSVKDFLSLSDDDIADNQPASDVRHSARELPPPSQLSPAHAPCRAKSSRDLLTLSPPLASRPAAAAAIEAHRIATKYDFGLVYVVNLWPSHMSRASRSSPLDQLCGTPITTSQPRPTPLSSPPESPVSYTSGDDSGFDDRMPHSAPRGGSGSGMTGRLLAAYGLPQIMSPFRISAPVHQKILRTPGWLEYRSDTGSTDEFARGYSCSFYTGHSPARTTNNGHYSTAASTTTHPAVLNRGIVFAAFRLPREDGTPVECDANELAHLHRDAEKLVDLLIEMHMTQRKPRARAAASAAAVPTPANFATTGPCVGSDGVNSFGERKGRAGAGVVVKPPGLDRLATIY